LCTLLLAGVLVDGPWDRALGALAEGQAPDQSANPVLLPALRSAALEHGFRLDGFDPFDAGRRLRAGDSVTALFMTSNGGQVKQWVVELKVAAPAAAGQGRSAQDVVMYTATGHQMQFRSGIADMSVRILGPVAEGDVGPAECPEKTAATTAHQDYLRLGAFGLCRAVWRFAAKGEEPRIGFSTVPFTPADIEKGKKAARDAGVTVEEETAFAGGAEALNEFTRNAEDIPGIMGIATQGMDWPSVWTMLREMNFNIWSTIDWKGTAPVDQKLIAGADQVYRLPFDLYMFGSHISHGTWFIARPDSPLSVCGGIVGIWLQSVKHPENRMFMRVIAAHREN